MGNAGDVRVHTFHLPTMRLYHMVRDTDVTGVSGTGTVAEVVEFTDGTVVLRWLGAYRSTAVYPDMATARQIHGHDGATRMVPVT